MTSTEDRELRRALHGTLQSMQPSPVPLETIIRRSNGIRLRRAGAAVAALGLAAVTARTRSWPLTMIQLMVAGNCMNPKPTPGNAEPMVTTPAFPGLG